jgi:hypothetical protein
MNRSRASLVFAAGLLVGLAIAVPVAGLGDRAIRRAAAQQDQRAPAFQISSWAHSAAPANNGVLVDRSQYGAYVIDTRSGKVWLIVGQGEPRSIGQGK